MPKDRPWIGELNIYGGRNVVLIGGEVRIPSPEEDPSFGKGEDGKQKRSRRAVYLQGTTGTIHIEGLLISGEGLHEGFNVAEREPGCIVQLQNIRCETLHGSFSANHADVVQSWAGLPRRHFFLFTSRCLSRRKSPRPGFPHGAPRRYRSRP